MNYKSKKQKKRKTEFNALFHEFHLYQTYFFRAEKKVGFIVMKGAGAPTINFQKLKINWFNSWNNFFYLLTASVVFEMVC